MFRRESAKWHESTCAEFSRHWRVETRHYALRTTQSTRTHVGLLEALLRALEVLARGGQLLRARAVRLVRGAELRRERLGLRALALHRAAHQLLLLPPQLHTHTIQTTVSSILWSIRILYTTLTALI